MKQLTRSLALLLTLVLTLGCLTLRLHGGGSGACLERDPRHILCRR